MSTPQQPQPQPQPDQPAFDDRTTEYDPTSWIPRSQPVPEPPRPRISTRLVVGISTAALLVGGVSGAAGAALWHEWNEPISSLSGSSDSGSGTAQVSSRSTAGEGSVEQVASTVLPSVVRIDVVSGSGAGSGSGIILSEDGQILTNAHVVEGAGENARLTVSFNDGSSAPATVLGSDPLTDTAVIQATDVSGLTPATIGTSGDLAVGQSVVAIGSPFGLDATVTSGIVSALDRPVNVGSDDRGNSTTYPAIQTDAAINPGNSGGPLVDMDGNLVGINSSIRTTSSLSDEGGSIGLGFAIPIDSVLPIIEQIRGGETPTHARLGISVTDVGASTTEQSPRDGSGSPFGDGPRGFFEQRPGQPSEEQPDEQQQEEEQSQAAAYGAVVREVAEGSTAAEAGLAEGDVVIRLDERRIADADTLVATVRSYRPGDSVTVTWIRDGKEQHAEVELGSDATSSTS